jgi:HK97 family phage portal protein
MELISLNLPSPEGFTKFRNDGASTLAAPSADLVQALMGFPAAAGKAVTRTTAIRVAAFLSAVKTLANDIAKMPLILHETKTEGGRSRTQHAISNPLYSILKDCPNDWQTSFQLRWFLASQLIMNGNCFCQKIEDQAGRLLALVPLDAWQMSAYWDRTNPNQPQLKWRYSSGAKVRLFDQSDLWHVASINIDGNGIEGAAIIALAKEALSILMAAEEVAGRNFANGLGMGGFITFPPEVDVDEKQAQNVVDQLKKNFAGSQNAGKFSALPLGAKFEKMTFNAQESQLLESRKWNEEEVVRLLGGAPLLVKLGLGAQNSTYASSSAFLDEYFNTTLLPYTTAIEQSITRDLVAPKDRGRLVAKHSADIILRGSPKERAETYEIKIRSGQMSPNEAAALEDRDGIDGFGDFRFFPANCAYFDPATGEAALAGQKPPVATPAEESKPTQPEHEAGPDTEGAQAALAKVNGRLLNVANSLAERVMRKEAKGGLDAKFVAEVLSISPEKASAYLETRKTLNDQEARATLVALVTGD